VVNARVQPLPRRPGARRLLDRRATLGRSLLGSRSETLRGLGGPGRDERFALMDTRATAFAGNVAIAAVIGLWLWEVAHGRDGGPYAQIGAISGLAYVFAIAVLRWRS
jgi:hypothetical protein